MADGPTGELGSLFSVLNWPLILHGKSCFHHSAWKAVVLGIVIDSDTANAQKVLRAGIAHLISHKPHRSPVIYKQPQVLLSSLFYRKRCCFYYIGHHKVDQTSGSFSHSACGFHSPTPYGQGMTLLQLWGKNTVPGISVLLVHLPQGWKETRAKNHLRTCEGFYFCFRLSLSCLCYLSQTLSCQSKSGQFGK